MKVIKNIAKFVILPFCLIVIFNFLEYGLIWDDVYKFLYPLLLAGIFMLNIQVPRFRHLFLILSYCMLALMVLLYLANHLDLSNSVGSIGLAILIITLFAYLPELIKEGYLKNFK